MNGARKRCRGMRLAGCLATLALWGTGAAPAHAREWKVYESKQYGFSLKVPAEFELQSEDKGATWLYQPGATNSGGTASRSAMNKAKFRVNVRNTMEEVKHAGAIRAEEATESALTIYVNWVWMPEVSSDTLYNANKRQDEQNMVSGAPDYCELAVFAYGEGYAHEGNTYWLKETNKATPGEIHRWHIKSYGNNSAYTVGLCGAFGQFKEWGPVYAEMVKSWRLIPLEKP